MNALLNYPGAKWGMAEEIVSLMPPHRSYLEPFFGSGAVLFNKPPSAIETVNDIDGDIVNFFTVLREQPEELARLIDLTPYARDVFDDAHHNRGGDPLDRAYRFAIRSKMGYGFKTYTQTGFKIDIAGRQGSYASKYWAKMPELVQQLCGRLKEVQIEKRPALDLIRRFNFDNVLIYADPPYLLDTRGGKQYRHEMTEQDHIDLLAALLQHKGPVILSGYPSEMYDRELRGWSRITRKSYNQNADQRTEVLWCNFEVGQTSLFDKPMETSLPRVAGCHDCFCRKCLLWWSGRCPYGECYDEYRAEVHPYDAAHLDEPPRKLWSEWNRPGEQAHWCRGGTFYPADSCEHYIPYSEKDTHCKSCLDANVVVYQDGYIQCSIVDSVGCEACYRRLEKKQ